MTLTKSVLLVDATFGVGVTVHTLGNAQAATEVNPIPQVLRGSWYGKYQHVPVMYKLTKYTLQEGATVDGHWKSKPMTFHVKTATSVKNKYSLFTVSKQANKHGYWDLKLLESKESLYFKPVKHHGKSALYKYHIDREYVKPRLDVGYFYKK
uniref:hypothetical protein n=1 Tax=Lentilactobacillus hilgardii TaxID=1588 RepID=UPI00403F05C0